MPDPSIVQFCAARKGRLIERTVDRGSELDTARPAHVLEEILEHREVGVTLRPERNRLIREPDGPADGEPRPVSDQAQIFDPYDLTVERQANWPRGAHGVVEQSHVYAV